MRAMITVPGSRGPRHVLVEGPEHLTAADVHAHLGAPGPPPAPLQPVHGYAAGAVGPCPSPPLPRLVVADGPDAGASVLLAPGMWTTVGRDPSCDLRILDPALSRRHLRVRAGRGGVTVDDLGSTNGLHWSPARGPQPEPAPTDGPALGAEGPAGPSGGRVPPAGPHRWPPGHDLLVGSSRLRLLTRPGAPLPARPHAGRAAVRPWPRTVPPRPETALTTPAPPQPRAVLPPSAWSWGLPLTASVALAVVLRMPFLLLFGLMAPVMMFGHHLGERRRVRLEHREAAGRHDEELLRLDEDRRRAVAADLRALRSRHPGLGGTVAALLPVASTDLWCRAQEPVEVVLGRTGCRSAVHLDAAAVLHADGPVLLDLAEPLTVVGPAPLRDGLVRSVLLQAVTAHPPSTLSVLVDPDAPPGDAWDLLAWLPHTRRAAHGDGAVALRWGRDLSLVEDVGDAPAGRPRVEVLGLGQAVLRRPGEHDVVFVPTMLGLPLARHLARLLGGYAEDLPGGDTGRMTVARTLGDLVPWPADADEVRRGWAPAGGPPGLAVPVGTDRQGGPVVVDLVHDGPHALVAGTTGSGKSELLRTLVAGLALAHPPSRLGVLLMDYKGGSSLGQLSALPHAVGLVTDLDPYLAQRVLVSLRAELRRRERQLEAEGLRDVAEGKGRIPRLLIVVDEFRVLAEELPDFLSGLVRVATVGRSLGVHLVLATQRPGGVVSPDLRANVNLRVALRVRDVADSLDVLDVPDAARLPEGQPGAALLRTGSGPTRALQVVQVAPPVQEAPPSDAGCDRSGRGRPTIAVREVADAWEGWRALVQAEGGSPTGQAHGAPAQRSLDDLVELLRSAADAAAPGQGTAGRAAPVWHPSLPERLPDPAPGVWALADRPDQQSLEPLTWDGAGHVALVGAPRSGRSTAARSLVKAAGPAWLYVVDPARGLEGTELTRHPGLRAWVGPDEPAHGTAVLRALGGLIDRRRARDAPEPAPVILVVDGWDRWVHEQEGNGGEGRDLALRVLRDGPAAGVSVVLTGDRQLVTGTVAKHVPETWLLPTHDPTDVAAAGLRPAQVPQHHPPGRVVRTRDALVAQVHLPPARPGGEGPPPGEPPPRILALPRRLAADGPWAVGGDGAEPVPCPSGSVLVLGPAGSGVTHTLGVLARARKPVGRQGAEAAEVLWVAGPGSWDDRELAGALEGSVDAVVLDEAHLVGGSRTEDLVIAWAERTGGRLLVGGELAACSSLFRGAVPFVGRHRTGLVLQPSLAGHGAQLAVDLPTGDVKVPGRGVLVARGRCTRVQVRAPGASRAGP